MDVAGWVHAQDEFRGSKDVPPIFEFAYGTFVFPWTYILRMEM